MRYDACPICTRDDAQAILDARQVSMAEALRTAAGNVSKPALYRWFHKHDEMGPHPIGKPAEILSSVTSLDPATAPPEAIQRDILTRLLLLAEKATEKDRTKIAALKAAGEIAAALQKQAQAKKDSAADEDADAAPAEGDAPPAWMQTAAN